MKLKGRKSYITFIVFVIIKCLCQHTKEVKHIYSGRMYYRSLYEIRQPLF